MANRLGANVSTFTATISGAGHELVADRLDQVIVNGEAEQAKALLAILIAELRVNGRSEILPTYRVGAPVVCAPSSSVEPTGIEPVTSCLQSRRSPS
jgi:hypothetical protein